MSGHCYITQPTTTKIIPSTVAAVIDSPTQQIDEYERTEGRQEDQIGDFRTRSRTFERLKPTDVGNAHFEQAGVDATGENVRVTVLPDHINHDIYACERTKSSAVPLPNKP